MTTVEPLMVADDIVAGYLPGIDVLKGCSLNLADGELVGVLGPNGAGKSTLIKAMFGLIPVRSGRITLAGNDITNLSAHELVARGVGFVPQSSNVFATLTVEENLLLGSFLRPKAYSECLSDMVDLFPLLGQRLHQKAGSMSGGERQLLATARALMARPSVLLLDEPSAGLSPAYQTEVFDRIAQINANGMSIVMVEQNARRCLQICHRAYVLDQGRNAHTGTGQELLADPRVVELYLGTLGKVR